MADAVVSILLDQLAWIIRHQIEQGVTLVNGVEKEIAALKTNLQAIQDVLHDAEKRQLTENSVRRWLDELKDVSNDMDDVLDEWGTAILLSEMEKRHRNPTTSKVLSRFSRFLTCCLFSGEFSQLGHRRLDIATKIKELNGKLQDIAVRKDRYGFRISSEVNGDFERPKSTSIVDVSEVHGRDKDKENLVRKLLGKSDQEESVNDLNVIAILGMAGIGKTTLAQLAYNDDRVKSHFEKRIWVCVSDPFDVVKLAKAIVEQITGQAPSFVELESLMHNVIDSMRDKKFLLVLDDVWTDDYLKWEPLKQALKCGHVESRILVTTRKEEVAIMMGGAGELIQLEKLSDEDCWSLFSQVAFFGRRKEEQEELEEIGKEIVSKCKGLPLAAKTLGSHMHFKKTREQWKDVLHSEIWELEEAKRNLFSPLLLSFYDLSPTVKRCFMYCAVFPKDHQIDRDDLIQQWMSQGFFSFKKNVQMEMLGEECFENLAMRCFFQDFVKDYNGAIIACKMHDIVHDFVQFLTVNEYATTEIEGVEERLDTTAGNTRHLTLILPPEACIPVSILNKKHLHTLMVLGPKIAEIAPHHFLHLKYLRTLILSGCLIAELPKNLGELIHLRYLNLSYNPMLKELPSTVGNLCNLHTLRLVSCRSIRELPATIGKLSNLRHLYIHGRNLLEFLPKGISGLSSLQTIYDFPVPVPVISNSQACQLGDMENLNHLRRLRVNNLANEKDVEEARKAQLKNKENLTELILTFWRNTKSKIQIDVLEALEPHPNLQSLGISCYRGGSTVAPSWMMSLTNLRWLVLRSCSSCEILPPLGKLPSLELLEISRFEKLENVGPEFLGTKTGALELQSSIVFFPRLKELRFRYTHMRKWIGIPEWKVGSPITIMPRLHSLKLDNCIFLEVLPDFVQEIPLQNLIIEDCPRLQKNSQEILDDERTKICHVPNVQIFNRFYDGHQSDEDEAQ